MTKKQAIGYCRISTEDQSHFSIPYQKEQILYFCKKNDYELVRMFVDEGQSAKNFDRREWKKLNEFLKKNEDLNYLVVLKYDRFSRNIVEALTVIENLETTFGIALLSVMEPIALPSESPFYFQIRANMLLNAHHERLVIRERTVTGMTKAAQEGYYMGKAPFGYINSRDENGKPILEIDIIKGEIIQNIFERYLQGYPFEYIGRMAREEGLTHKGNGAIQRILRNKVYAGWVNSGFGKAEKNFVKGNHSPLIDEYIFDKVQMMLKRRKPRIHHNSVTWLKGAIVCQECYHPMTVCRSKGNTKYYWYYECRNHRVSKPMTKAHDVFTQILDELVFTEAQIQYVQKAVTNQLQVHIKQNYGKLPGIISQKTKAFQLLESTEEKYLSGKLDDDTFAKWRTKLKTEINSLEKEIEFLQTAESKYWNTVIKEFELLKGVKDVFFSADDVQKRRFVEIGFGKELVWTGEVYRTDYLNPIFLSKSLRLRRKGLLELTEKKGSFENFPYGSP